MHLSGSISWNRIHGRGRRKGAFFTVKVESHLTGKGNFHPIRREELIKVGMQIFFLQKRRLVQQSTLQDEYAATVLDQTILVDVVR